MGPPLNKLKYKELTFGNKKVPFNYSDMLASFNDYLIRFKSHNTELMVDNVVTG